MPAVYVHFVVVNNGGVAQPPRRTRGINIYEESPPQAVIATYRTEPVAHRVAILQISGVQEHCYVRQYFIRQ